MSAGGWGCPHEIDGVCGKLAHRPCDPGMKGCELYGRFVFFDPGKNARLEQKQQRAAKKTDAANPDAAPAESSEAAPPSPKETP